MLMGGLSGWINGCEQVVYDREISAGEGAQSSISTGNILNGDEDGWYTIILRVVNATSYVYYQTRFNNDSGNNYGALGIQAQNTSTASVAQTDLGDITGAWLSTTGAATGPYSLSVMRLYAKSGAVRLYNTLCARYITGTTVNFVDTVGGVWNNTADNITSMTFYHSGAGSLFEVGSRIIILKSNNFTGGTPTGSITTPYIKGSWVRVGSQVLASAASSVTFSGLDGDRDVVYYISASIQSDANYIYPGVRPNNVSTAGNYGVQFLRGGNTTIDAARATDANLWLEASGTGTNAYAQYNMLIFAKKGFIRPAISQSLSRVSGTTVTYIDVIGQSWNNTTDNITSLVVVSNTNNFKAGSQFDLYALRPNG